MSSVDGTIIHFVGIHKQELREVKVACFIATGANEAPLIQKMFVLQAESTTDRWIRSERTPY